MPKATHGRFAWYDLMTTNPEAAQAFYTETIGWKTQASEGGMPYTMFVAGEAPIAGVMELPEDAAKMGAPPNWLPYVAVSQCDESASLVTELGGQVLKQPWDIPDVGRIAIAADPLGATFGLFQPSGDMELSEGHTQGSIDWHELNTTDWKAGFNFYKKLFDWKATSDMDMGPEMGTYQMYTHAESDRLIGGMSDAAGSMGMPPHWLCYTTVDDLDATLERVKAKGGKVMIGPMEVPGGDRVASCMDPQGAAFAVYEEGDS